MSQYCSYDDLVVSVDAVSLAAMTNDYDGNQTVNLAVINAICTQASNKTDALISSIYTPFGGNPPAKVKEASIIFALEILYARRLTPDEKNPWKAQATMWSDMLNQVNLGLLSLDAQFNRNFVPIVWNGSPNRVNTNIF